MKALKHIVLSSALLCAALQAQALSYSSYISIKRPGNPSRTYQLVRQGDRLVNKGGNLPLVITCTTATTGHATTVTVTFKALRTIYFNFGAELNTGFNTDDCDFYLPGFWYHKNMRSPEAAPSFKTSKSWNVREDRLSSPLSGVFEAHTGRALTVKRKLTDRYDALTTSATGEVILSGRSSVGYVGFDNKGGHASLTFGYPYIETPKRYIRKLTLADPIYAFTRLPKGRTVSVTWVVMADEAKDYSDFIAKTWTDCFDFYAPQPLHQRYTPEETKRVLTNYFRESFVSEYPLKFNSGHSLLIDKCESAKFMQVGFCGRAILNAFNEIEYGEAHQDAALVEMGQSVIGSFLANGFTRAGYLIENAKYEKDDPYEDLHSIRQQSEGVYALFHYLKYEKLHGRSHKDLEKKVLGVLNNFLRIQRPDGSFARKFHDDGSDIDASCGSTPSATVPLVMAWKFFGNRKYLNAAARSVEYLEKNIISKSDYFSSTLDANCEDKEAAISAVTATYYMALVTKGKEQAHYLSLCRQSAYFAMSWYYLWDVPFAKGQMLGDLGFRSRGFSNVSVENNHVDVFVFELATILKWLADKTGERQFAQMHDLIYSSLNQLLPVPNRLCGIAKPGFYPEVVQHTCWDYGRNGKGFYNSYFAPGWTIASLWELYTPNRTADFFK